MGRAEVTEYVEASDCLLMLGCFLTDINLGIFTAKLDPSRCIDATSEDLRIRHHHYRDVRLDDFIRGLHDRGLKLAHAADPAEAAQARASRGSPEPDAPVTSARLFARLDRMLDDSMIVIADIGDSPLRRRRPDDEPPDGVHQPGLLHVDGLRRPRGRRRGDREPGARGRW